MKIIDTLLWIILGSGIGSILCMIYHKLRDKEPIIAERIRCKYCDTELEPINMLPIIGWWKTRGRCAVCGAAISKHHIICESLGAIIGGIFSFFMVY